MKVFIGAGNDWDVLLFVPTAESDVCGTDVKRPGVWRRDAEGTERVVLTCGIRECGHLRDSVELLQHSDENFWWQRSSH